MPLVGFVDEISRRGVTGWAVDTDHPDRTVNITVNVNGKRSASASPDLYRPDVSESMRANIPPDLHGSMTGIYGFEVSFDPPLSVFQESYIDVRFTETGGPLPHGTKRLSAPRPVGLSLRPVLLTSYGRSGTTILMQYLARHPSIVVAEHYPFEINLLSYYTRAFQVLVSPSDRERSSNPETIDNDPNFIGYNYFNRPYFYSLAKNPKSLETFFEQTVPQTYLNAISHMLNDFYARLKHDQEKADAIYFAEKCSMVDTLRAGARLFCTDTRELLLIRDPRDVMCSARSFWGNTTKCWVDDVARCMRKIEEAADAASSDTMVVRYEDLVTRPAPTLRSIYAFLGVDEHFSFTYPLEDAALFTRHGTSSTPAKSIGRWKSDLTPAEIGTCNNVFAGFLERFGYPRGEDEECDTRLVAPV